MADILIRNLPAELHGRLKAAAAAHRRSVTQEAIVVIEQGLGAAGQLEPRPLPEPVKLRRPTSIEETQRFIDDDIAERGF